ncbi:SCO1664 family protein [Ornithinimicrobium sp. Y1694]|uniref:SCO1664 family protein n=1 Tax=Ornithinimicrobium sp. Y1694 TaxID=3418590 RepID=UPI003CF006C3
MLRSSILEPVGRLREASNVTLLVDLHEADGRPTGQRAVYKPIRGERPLADFPTGTLGAREVAAHIISEGGGWGLVPPTVLRDGPLGPGSAQLWMELDVESADLVDVVQPEEAAEARWRAVVDVVDEEGRPLVVVHADDPRLRSLAVLDAVIDNADRKAAHLGLAGERLWGFDHGLSFNVEPKLRTVLWGWSGEELGAQEVGRLERVRELVNADGELTELLSGAELDVLGERVEDLLREGRLPIPPEDRYPLPWPLW